MNNKKTIISIIVVSILLVLSVVLFTSNKKEDKIIKNKDFIKLESNTELEDFKEYKIYKSYSELQTDFKLSKIKETDFNNNNYLVIEVNYNPCSDGNITPTSYDIKNNKVNIEIKYKRKCGLCAPSVYYYALKVDKKLTNPKIKIDYKSTNKPNCDPNVAYKPMIYLYPSEKMDVKVVLKNKKLLTTTYPKYKDSWEVIADTDGTLIDKESGREYYGLYWEGKNYTKINEKKGFVVKGKDTIKFLEEKLNELGLTNKEAEEFIVYWLPKLEKNNYNYIYFAQTDEVNKYMPLEVTPEPDSMIRILMYYRPLNKKKEVKEQKIKQVYRKDFTLVEWGGTELK